MSEATAIAKLTSDDIQPSRVSFYVNQAQRDVANRVQQLEFERIAVSSTSSGEDKLFLPADCERVLALSFATGASHRIIPQTDLDGFDSRSQGTLTGLPQVYASYASWLEFYPSPDSAYSLQLRYLARLSEVTNLDQVPSVDTRYHQAVLFKTVHYLELRKGDPVRTNWALGLYERELDAQPSARAQRQLNRAGMHARVQFKED